MQSQVVPGLEIVRVEGDRDLEAMITVRAVSDPDRPPPQIENLRHNLASSGTLVYVVGRLDDEPVACGFVDPSPADHAEAHLVVVPEARRRGVGSALLAWFGDIAVKPLQGEVRESDAESLAFLGRRGYAVVGGEKAVALDLAQMEEPVPAPPAGVTIVSLAERPDVVDALYPIAVEAIEDIPGNSGPPTYAQWRAIDVDRPTRKPELFFVALAGAETIGYATMDDFGRDAHHGLTTVTRHWRRRGVATALKRAQIAAARQAGFRRVVTRSEERNTPMRNLNAKLGYKPEPSLSVVVLRGPADPR